MKQWRCFFCDEVFDDKEAARLHFGNEQMGEPACQISASDGGLLARVRELEATIHRYVIEEHGLDSALASVFADHTRALIRAEQEGYDKGLADGRGEWTEQRKIAVTKLLQSRGLIWHEPADQAEWMFLAGFLAGAASRLADAVNLALDFITKDIEARGCDHAAVKLVNRLEEALK